MHVAPATAIEAHAATGVAKYPAVLTTSLAEKLLLAAFTAERLTLLLLAPPFTAIISFCSILYYPPYDELSRGFEQVSCMHGGLSNLFYLPIPNTMLAQLSLVFFFALLLLYISGHTYQQYENKHKYTA